MVETYFYHVPRAKTLPLTEHRLPLRLKKLSTPSTTHNFLRHKALPPKTKKSPLRLRRAVTEQSGNSKSAEKQKERGSEWLQKEEEGDSAYLMSLLRKLDNSKYKMNNGSLLNQLAQSMALPSKATRTVPKSTMAQNRGILRQLQGERGLRVPKRRRDELKMRMRMLSMGGPGQSRP